MLTLYQVDAFTDRPLSGNPAAVIPLDAWPSAAWMLSVARENNLSETAYFVPDDPEVTLRWFTPTKEVDLCGHATLATAFVVFHFLSPGLEKITFQTKNSGPLHVVRQGKRLAMDFPADALTAIDPPPELAAALGVEPIETHQGMDLLALLPSERDVAALKPDWALLHHIETRGIIATAPGSDCDFVSRFFAPREGIDEDPVTGSAHTALTPFWAARLGKKELRARQISLRVGDLWCVDRGDRVEIAGEAVLYMKGALALNPESH